MDSRSEKSAILHQTRRLCTSDNRSLTITDGCFRAEYDSTVKTIGFDEVRVRYRQQRRALVRDIILKKLAGTAMRKYASFQTLKLVKKEDQDAFLKDVLEDLKEMDQSRIIVFGMTLNQLKAWMAAQ